MSTYFTFHLEDRTATQRLRLSKCPVHVVWSGQRATDGQPLGFCLAQHDKIALRTRITENAEKHEGWLVKRRDNTETTLPRH